MESAAVAKVAVSAATYAIDKPYDYLIPAALADRAAVGMRVSVPFGRGNRSSEGVILALGTAPRAPGLKALASVLDEEPVLDSAGVALALFLRQRCFCTMYEAVRTILPAGLWYRYRETFRLCLQDREAADAASGHIRGAGAVLDALFSAGGELELEALKAACGESGESAARALCKKGVLCCQTQAQRRVGDKTHCLVTLAVSAEEALAAAERGGRSSPLRREALRLLAVSSAATAADLCYYTGASLRTIKALEKSGLVRLTQEEELRVPSPDTAEPGLPIVLSEEQEQVFGRLLSLTRQDRPEAALLEGVTGSGKTAVYLRLVQEVLHAGRTAMVLVPEIVLTPQMMRKFASYFGSRVVMLHSGLRLSERYDQWKRIRRGEVDVVLGTRSAVFAPVRELGLVILDEEQEDTYKSENTAPLSHPGRGQIPLRQGRRAAAAGLRHPRSWRARWAAETGIYTTSFCAGRFNKMELPGVRIADMRGSCAAETAAIISSRAAAGARGQS
jgi:primosomal protein N' (replication factor Y)